MIPLGEPLLTDGRLEKIERQIRQDFPRLQEQVTFVTYVQEPVWATVRGIDVQIPRAAVLAILVANPRYPGDFRMFQKGATLDAWRKIDWSTRHDSDVHADPAYRALKSLIPEIIEWCDNLRAMNN